MPTYRDDIQHPGQQYTAWVGRKKAALRRRLLDCGCPYTGEVFYHLGCDLLTCEEHAQDGHDCSAFGGVKSGSEEESVDPEAVVEGRADDTFVPTRVLWLPPGSIANPLAPTIAELDAGILLNVTVASDGVEATTYVAPDHTHWRWTGPGTSQVTTMTEAEADEVDRRQRLSIECGGMGLSLLMCSGCDGLALDHFPCIHDCHEPAVCSCPEVDVSAFTERSGARTVKGYDPGCRVCPDPYAPPVDAALEPDPDDWERVVMVEAPEDGDTNTWGAVQGRIEENTAAMRRLGEPYLDESEPRPWWRRILPGGR